MKSMHIEYRGTVLKPVSRILTLHALILLTVLLGCLQANAVYAQEDELQVRVDGRAVTVNSVQAELDGTQASLDQVLAEIGPEPVVANLVELDEQGTGIPLANAEAIIHGREIDLAGLAPLLADKGALASGSVVRAGESASSSPGAAPTHQPCWSTVAMLI